MKAPASEILVPDTTTATCQLAEIDQKLACVDAGLVPPEPSLVVDRRSPVRTVQPHGMSGPELERLAGAVHFMEAHFHRQRAGLWLATTDKGTARAVIANIWKRITRQQRKHNLPQYSVVVFEGAAGRLHAHITFTGNRDIGRHLKASAAFGSMVSVQPVTDLDGLVRGYLAKERTPQAGYGRNHLLGGRLRGSHRLDGGGDRVRLSVALERDAIAARQIAPWEHSNARRSAQRKSYRLRRLSAHKAPRLAGQLPLLPEIERPVSRLHDFGGGFVPPAVALEIEFRRRQLGLSQVQFASRLGISQGQYANAVRGHDPISSFAINRAREAVSL
jgi:hypothetical protein